MIWWSDYREDMKRYVALRGGLVVSLLTEQGLWALFQYRVASSIYRSSLSPSRKRLLLLLTEVWRKPIEIATGISLPYRASIEPGFYIGHFGNIFVHPDAVIGERCNIHQGVTIGISGRGAARGVPTIGDRVYIGPGASVLGKLSIGDDAVISANSLVVGDVPAHTTAMGVPARVISKNGSEEFIKG